MVALMWAGLTRMTWDKMKQIINDLREQTQFPRLYSE